ncbi:hypothetical protein GLOIN_2v981704 [Rhizophagus irregularis DAOM 181602=DAOM 197198]|uniref:Uncharacterized protein n=1 Tax=Rhizophagus irregularis (strain DAOM 181602 / DAOM 197198 / MUCL 43194) TaxID=747089 RepID=A0A2P4NXL4_RHIID|nr:hypothetical protein GLOIN_2v981704 [Rhizophagus irregularis DAOM 181602=DAOM 197198]POG57876.1 hypothetical protein GLOIN_2v981704 [Rhizophagus irregularis DAOM 181602=DAOM 197198]|eukprot:XP_025164742.1 hypothetical protein GLOIN_2v981704 [Rhizophagus irregularis DAOM 181602=DAOM 197198]
MVQDFFFFRSDILEFFFFFVGILTLGDLDDCRYYMRVFWFPVKLNILMFLFSF